MTYHPVKKTTNPATVNFRISKKKSNSIILYIVIYRSQSRAKKQKSAFYLIFGLTFLERIMSSNVALLTAPVTLTEGAKKEIIKLIAQQELGEDYGLRLGVEGGGCSGMSYVLGFDQKKDGDQEYLIDDIKVFMHKAHGLYLVGMEVDFQNGLNARGFTFSNPNASSTCGCGTSFSV
jgi:iron-sulfur cluster assembly protein